MPEDLSKPAEELDCDPEEGYCPPVVLEQDKEGVIDLGALVHTQYPGKPSEAPCPDSAAWEFIAEVATEVLHDKLFEIETRSNSEHIHRLGMTKMLAAFKEVAKQLANCRVGKVQTYYFEDKDEGAKKEFKLAEDQWNRGIRR